MNDCLEIFIGKVRCCHESISKHENGNARQINSVALTYFLTRVGN